MRRSEAFGPPRIDIGTWITPPAPTTPFRAELLTAIRIPHPVATCSFLLRRHEFPLVPSKGLTVSISSNGVSPCVYRHVRLPPSRTVTDASF